MNERSPQRGRVGERAKSPKGKSCKVNYVKRKTSAGNQVYKINLTARANVEAFLLAIQPYVIGVKTGDKIKAMLAVCEEHKAWEAAGGKKEAARVANKASQQAKKLKSK